MIGTKPISGNLQPPQTFNLQTFNPQTFNFPASPLALSVGMGYVGFFFQENQTMQENLDVHLKEWRDKLEEMRGYL